jgi:hypothetical protein
LRDNASEFGRWRPHSGTATYERHADVLGKGGLAVLRWGGLRMLSAAGPDAKDLPGHPPGAIGSFHMSRVQCLKASMTFVGVLFDAAVAWWCSPESLADGFR